ncbi:precorrin-6A/cobalt-precorrin-6A reductase [Larsenimonas rhizosphaerae]|uniref:precorrin-6A/cobalt-precorrin-6A reductase n=1 Tax=Larsenimonas rhizosphaerae TaxID=2944682 RepID=UPI0020335198|nr:precorrin-6A/cobalt-precorrin-6A reductase [Larsenimonas rhizosphaerae]MCM2130482.1 precorrin-6A/cobalt-precorrin-6A reductase [Larsenimonas rhizosphaerae]
MKVLILGGTGQARRLAEALNRLGVPLLYSIAGRLPVDDFPFPTRVGGFSGPERTSRQGLDALLRKHHITDVLDATHPFAARISETAATAAQAAGLPCWQLIRPYWQPHPDDQWHYLPDIEALGQALDAWQRPLITLGASGLPLVNRALPSQQMVIRSAQTLHVPPPHELVIARGPFNVSDELATLRRHGIDCVVTKDSGGHATSAKLHAARALKLPVLLLRRPALPVTSRQFDQPADLIRALCARPARACNEEKS